jgi:hypothetical protein
MLNTTHCPSSDSPPLSERQHFLMSWGQKLLDSFRNILRHLGTAPELQVQQQRDRAGNLYWLAYNPKTGKSYASASEVDMRDWLERQYYF